MHQLQKNSVTGSNKLLLIPGQHKLQNECCCPKYCPPTPTLEDFRTYWPSSYDIDFDEFYARVLQEIKYCCTRSYNSTSSSTSSASSNEESTTSSSTSVSSYSSTSSESSFSTSSSSSTSSSESSASDSYSSSSTTSESSTSFSSSSTSSSIRLTSSSSTSSSEDDKYCHYEVFWYYNCYTKKITGFTIGNVSCNRGIQPYFIDECPHPERSSSSSTSSGGGSQSSESLSSISGEYYCGYDANMIVDCETREIYRFEYVPDNSVPPYPYKSLIWANTATCDTITCQWDTSLCTPNYEKLLNPYYYGGSPPSYNALCDGFNDPITGRTCTRIRVWFLLDPESMVGCSVSTPNAGCFRSDYTSISYAEWLDRLPSFYDASAWTAQLNAYLDVWNQYGDCCDLSSVSLSYSSDSTESSSESSEPIDIVTLRTTFSIQYRCDYAIDESSSGAGEPSSSLSSDYETEDITSTSSD